MKPLDTSFLILGLASACVTASAQGTLNFANRVVAAGIDAPIILVGVDPGYPRRVDGQEGYAQLLAGPAGGCVGPRW